MDDRTELIEGLRDLADVLTKHPLLPTPVVSVTGSMRWAHSFTDVLNLVEVLAPCTVEESMLGPDKKAISTTRGGVRIRVLVDSTAVGETRVVDGHPRFMVDNEVLRIAAHPKPTSVPA